HINDSDRIGLVGRNGSGKTTMLRIIAGVVTPSSGQIQLPGDLTIGYLPQEMDFDKDKRVIDAALEAFSHVKELEDVIARLNFEVADRTDYESEGYHKLLVRLNDATERLSLYTS